ncbi:DNA polymerase [Spiroplasma clarkii]|nr:DNA polymerase [Spiroplasma clarkii]
MMIAAYVLNSNVKSNFESHLNLIDSSIEIKTFDEIFGKGVKKTKQINKDIRNQYLINHALAIKQLETEIIKKLHESEQFELYQEIELPLCFALLAMEQEGVLIDRQELKSQSQNILEQLNNLEQQASKIVHDAGFELINFASPKQLKELLFDKLKLPDNKKGSTDKEVLDELLGLHPIVEVLQQIRKYQKLYSTYLKGFEKFIFFDNKVHTIYNQTLTNTGRLSSQDPNLQNISVRDPDQKQVRKIFIVEPGYTFLSYDYSQIELRVLADFADEKVLIEAYNSGVDIHELAARNIFDLPTSVKVTSEQRRIAKVFNFGILYGLTKYGLAKDLKISHLDAQKYIDAYNKTFPSVETYKKQIVEFGMNNGYVKTLANRRRYIYELQSSNYMLREFGKRAAINAPIQGTAADIIKIAMIDVHNWLLKNDSTARLVAQIHDELIIKVKTSEIEKYQAIIKEMMDNSYNRLFEIIKIARQAKVPLEVNGSVGTNWFELK